MKKLVLAFAAIAMLALGTSCSKEKTCVCTYEGKALNGMVQASLPIGEKVISEGSCSDLENQSSWANFNFGQLVDGKIVCKKK